MEAYNVEQWVRYRSIIFIVSTTGKPFDTFVSDNASFPLICGTLTKRKIIRTLEEKSDWALFG